MPSNISSGDLISDRYASALYDLASEKKVIDSILNNFKSLRKIINNNNDLSMLLRSPLISSKDKLDVILKISSSFNLDELSITFLRVISKNKRFGSLSSIILRFIDINANKRGEIITDITSATELSEIQKNNLKNQLMKILGDKLLLNYKIDKKIIGGLVVKIGSKMIDTSILNKINKLKLVMKGS